LPNHHLQSILEILQRSETTSNTDSYEHGGGWDNADFSWLNDPGALRRFLGNCDYLLEASDFDNGTTTPPASASCARSNWRRKMRRRMTCSTTKASTPRSELRLIARILLGEFICHHP
jgi:hypothetical protein